MSRLLPILFSLLFCSAFAAEPKITFNTHIKPIFKQHCLNCHNPDKAKGDLDLSSYTATVAGGSSGEIVVAGNSGRSVLVGVLTHDEEPSMPPKKAPIPTEQTMLVKKWIDGGLLENDGSKAKIAKPSIDLSVDLSSLDKAPDDPAMPGKLPKIESAMLLRPPPVTALAASPWAPLLAVAGHESILLYHSESLKHLGSLDFPERIPHVLKFSRNGELLLAAGGRGAHTGKVVLFDVRTGARKAEIGDETDLVLAADVSPDHKLVALGGPGKVVKVFRTDTGEQVYKIEKHTDWISHVAFSPDGENLATGDRNGNLMVWGARYGGPMFTLTAHKQRITGLHWRLDSQVLVSACEDGNIGSWGMEDGFALRVVSGHKNKAGNQGVVAMKRTRKGAMISAGRDNTVKYWQPNSSKSSTLQRFDDLPTALAFDYTGTRVFIGDYNGDVHVWDLKKNKKSFEEVGSFDTVP